MGRPREFDDTVVLDKVTRVFWTRGYEATSVDDLCAASGLSRSSLYAAFGDKHALLLQALNHYIETRIGNVREFLLAAGSLQDALSSLAAAIINEVMAGPGRRGCFIGNCAAEVAREDREAMALVREGIATMEGVFRAVLTDGQKRGELSPQADIEALARFLVAGFQGLRLMGKAVPDRERLEDIARVMLRCVN